MEGSLTHQDSMGTAETLHRGAIQFMTAGTGVYHQEHNKNTETPLRFIQMWINTRTRGLRPNYGSFQGDEASRRAGWAHIVGDVNKSGGAKPPIEINQDANLYVTELSDSTESRSITIPWQIVHKIKLATNRNPFHVKRALDAKIKLNNLSSNLLPKPLLVS